MSLITRMRKQDAVLWSRTGFDGYGSPVFGPPAPIRCRWEERQEEFVDAQGTRAISKAIVYVDRVIKAGDMLLRGVLTDLVTVATPKDNASAYEVKGFDRLPNLKNTEELLTAYL